MIRRSILFLAYVAACGIASHAQSGVTNASSVHQPPLATQRAIHQLEDMQERVFDLSQEQVITINSILLEENIALDSIREHPSGDPKTDGLARRNVWHDADVRVYAQLNDMQQVQYVLWKQEQRIKNLEKQRQHLQAA